MKETLNPELATTPTTWSLSKKIIFLFVIAYLFIHMFPFPFDNIPLIGNVFGYCNLFTDFITKQIANYGLGIYPFERIEGTSSGDTSFDYVKLLTTLLLAVVTTIILFVFTKKQSNYNKLFAFMLVYARYYLAFYLIGYGFAKTFDIQFQFPDLMTLEQRYGNSSPDHLLWTFMGFSRTYTAFTGWAEVTAGILLLFRKTSVLGCLISFTIMLNIVVLNFCYDVPVKIHSSDMLLITLFILSPNLKRVFNFLVLNKTTEINTPSVELPKRWMQITRLILKPILVVSIFANLLYDNYSLAHAAKPTTEINAMYKTTLFVLNKDTLPPLITNETRWDKIVIESDVIYFFAMRNGFENYLIDVDTLNKTITKRPDGDTSVFFRFKYKNLPDNSFSVSGKFKKDSVYVTFTKKAVKDYPLVSRGFHWINEN